MGEKARVVAIVALLAGGFVALKYSGYGGHGCCGAVDAGGESSEAVNAVPNPDDDATLIASQRYCPVMPDSQLGDMGTPVKVMVTGKDGVEKPVFVCCKSCKRKAMADPDKTLATVAELKAAVVPK
ncbi:MAG: hypothetical protein K8U57_10080 [Planctomycetes bacterium]|nr:hypothetical protein [Planctomycetota bacterium]